MLNTLLIIFGKLFSRFAKAFNLGHGSTWPGHIALKVNPDFIKDLLQNTNTKIVLVAGTNGKTTTSLMLKSILKESGKSVLHNASGANLRNGIASYLLLNTNRSGKITQDFAIFESDENTLPHLLNDISPTFLVVLNLFRDQLDRYGELTLISKK